MELKVSHLDGERSVTPGEVNQLQERLMRRWHARQEDRRDKADLLLVWAEVFAKEIRAVCKQFPVVIELLELKLGKLGDDFLYAVDRQKWQLGHAVRHDPGLVAVAELFAAQHEEIASTAAETVDSIRLSLQFPVIPKDKHPMFGRPARVKDDPKLLRLVQQFEPSIQCSIDVPFGS